MSPKQAAAWHALSKHSRSLLLSYREDELTEDCRLEEETLGVSRERARTIVDKALRKLSCYFRAGYLRKDYLDE